MGRYQCNDFESVSGYFEAQAMKHLNHTTPHTHFDDNGWQVLVQSGLFELAVPQNYGGAGKSWGDVLSAIEGLSRTCSDWGLILSSIAQLGAIRIVCNHGSESIKRSLLPQLMKGTIASTAVTERHSGSYSSATQCTAIPNENNFIINGEKTHITNAPSPEY